MRHQLILLSQKTADWPESATADALNTTPGMVVLTIVIAVVVAICLLSTMIWVFTGENPVEQIDELLRTDIESELEKWASKRELKKFKHGNIQILMKRCNKYDNSPAFMPYRYDNTPGVKQQDIFDFNLELLKLWMMLHKSDVTWENMIPYICYDRTILWGLLVHESEKDPVIFPDGLLEALSNRKEDFYNGLNSSMNLKAYNRKWTLLWFSAEAGNAAAKELLDWIEGKIKQGRKQKC